MKLFEAFESDTVTETIKFLTKKIGKENTEFFKTNLKRVKTNLNIPINEISDKDVLYTTKNKAVKIFADGPIDNRLNMYCLKYWFSVEKGLLGVTAIANKNFIGGSGTEMGSTGTELYSEEELYYITFEIGLRTGKLKPVTLYEVKTGDIVVVKLDYEYVTKGEIFIDEDGAIYVLQNRTSGSTPYNSSWRDRGYRYAFRLGMSKARPRGDQSNLCLYTEDDEPLSYDIDYTFRNNILLNGNFKYDTWDTENEKDVIRKADFCIVIYLDRLSKLVSTDVTKANRIDSREGAVALISDEYIKKANIKRYSEQMFRKFNISPESIDLTNISKILSNLVLGKDSFLYITSDSNNLYYLSGFAEHLYELFQASDYDKESSYKQLIDFYDTTNNIRGKNIIKHYDDNKKMIERSNEDIKIRLQGLYNKYIEIGTFIDNYIKSNEYETIDDIIILYYKLESIRKITLNDNFRIKDYTIRTVMERFHESLRYNINGFGHDLKNNYESTMESLEKQFRYVKSVLK